MDTAPIDPVPAARALGRLVTAVDDDRLADPTPCAAWSVADLLDHLGVVAAGFTALAHDADDPGHRQEPWTAPRRAALARDLDAMAAAWAAPEAWIEDAGAGPPGPELPRATWGLIGLTELVVHAWDLATALGREAPALPEPLLRACLAHVEEFVPRAPVPALWGDPVTADLDAPLLHRVVAVTGRTP